MIKAYFDGCCEPRNPGGTAAYGVHISKDGRLLYKKSEIVMMKNKKHTSNNVAEYAGFIEILDYLKGNGLQNEDIEIMGDSKLVICQMFGDTYRGGYGWKIKRGFYKPLALCARALMNDFSNLKGRWIPREQNSLADELSKAHLKKIGIVFKIQTDE